MHKKTPYLKDMGPQKDEVVDVVIVCSATSATLLSIGLMMRMAAWTSGFASYPLR